MYNEWRSLFFLYAMVLTATLKDTTQQKKPQNTYLFQYLMLLHIISIFLLLGSISSVIHTWSSFRMSGVRNWIPQTQEMELLFIRMQCYGESKDHERNHSDPNIRCLYAHACVLMFMWFPAIFNDAICIFLNVICLNFMGHYITRTILPYSFWRK